MPRPGGKSNVVGVEAGFWVAIFGGGSDFFGDLLLRGLIVGRRKEGPGIARKPGQDFDGLSVSDALPDLWGSGRVGAYFRKRNRRRRRPGIRLPSRTGKSCRLEPPR
jgi:hypothetical protein